MRVVIQRVREASVKINDEIVGEIQQGLLVLLGIEHVDAELDADYLIQKLIHLRIFGDEEGKMNLSVSNIICRHKKRKSPKFYSFGKTRTSNSFV